MAEIKTVTKISYTLELSEEEAIALYRLIGNHIGGNGPSAKILENIWNDMQKTGEFELNRNSFDIETNRGHDTILYIKD